MGSRGPERMTDNASTINEFARLDSILARTIGAESRKKIWESASRVLQHARTALIDGHQKTIMVLGHVQSGKTTAMSSLMALAGDEGVDIVVALLGTTTLLLDQNASRLSQALGIVERTDYRWTEMTNPRTKSDSRQIVDWIAKGRTVFIPLLKHAQRIDSLRQVIEDSRLGSRRILILDDEADQASLNTLVQSQGESRTHEAIVNLRQVCMNHAYIQYTATPYALLLVGHEDPLYPDVVEILEPGVGYTGGKEFFIDSREQLINLIPRGDEQGPQLPIGLPRSLRRALAAFFIGAADLLTRDQSNAPVSMLIHPHSKTSIQERYRFLLQNYLEDLRDLTLNPTLIDDLGEDFSTELQLHEQRVNSHLEPSILLETLKSVIREAHVSLLNSKTEIERIKWNESPIHLLIGGNKLDRGFTVEGLTVTYMNRPASDQIDTTEQRARAFGYRRDYLPFCQFYASSRTIELLTDIVRTEVDLRQEMSDAFLRGETVREWSEKVGLLLPEGSKPTRDAVVAAVTTNQLGWHYVRRPERNADSLEMNRKVIADLGLFVAPVARFGRNEFHCLEISKLDLVDSVVRPWQVPSFSPNWHQDHLLEAVARTLRFIERVVVVLMDVEENGDRRPREREWRDDIGFVNIFQGRDNPGSSGVVGYQGDRYLGEHAFTSGTLMVQIHRLCAKGDVSGVEYLVPAIFLGNRRLVRNQS